ncbi:GDSL-like lipase/acylhydrolase [Ceratobasidium theobromae]|uniref:GDSL-like lipase/acylhydrolase n=1 Tax=Ceratobasidium theobromae TaxID=1582974 RepID=A0A5N5QQR8_9AGAM|nr:GDSL-like lipase/acylhydrolase [Ceratobasidium theobromae]
MRSNFAILLAALAYAVNPTLAATKVMFLGDSITGSPGCWRALLWNQLINAGKTDIDFVGTLPAQGCGITYDGDNEGHGGYLATGIANQNLLPAWLAATTPDIVAMTLGTNDVWSSISPATITAAYSTLVDQMRASKPTMKILVAQILPMAPSGCTDCGQRVINLNSAIPAWAQNKSTSASPITVVDLWTGFNTTSDTYDGVHPNENGNAKIAASWYPTLYNTL